ncbi:endonuclease [Roseibium aggregatum]|uniref:Endonuclease n=1 Tax=Roseibium aggregatum TaxID=187304 RepID=A0A926P1L9_9HYPH|nr:endonuclease [Roseibium aggregatum]MBD1547318.1 endonuclease [Roseibium aggregatum]
MNVAIFAVIAVVFFILGLGGMMYIDHKFALSVDGRDYAIEGRKLKSDDPYVRRQFRKFFALRVAYSVFLLALLILVTANV